MKDIPRISDAEWEVMKILWSKSPITASQIIDALSDTTDWKPKTIKTLVSRLVKKGAIGFDQENRVYCYYPLVDEDECLKAESESFLNKVYGGALKPMLINFLKEERLSGEDIEELRRILDERNE